MRLLPRVSREWARVTRGTREIAPSSSPPNPLYETNITQRIACVKIRRAHLFSEKTKNCAILLAVTRYGGIAVPQLDVELDQRGVEGAGCGGGGTRWKGNDLFKAP